MAVNETSLFSLRRCLSRDRARGSQIPQNGYLGGSRRRTSSESSCQQQKESLRRIHDVRLGTLRRSHHLPSRLREPAHTLIYPWSCDSCMSSSNFGSRQKGRISQRQVYGHAGKGGKDGIVSGAAFLLTLQLRQFFQLAGDNRSSNLTRGISIQGRYRAHQQVRPTQIHSGMLCCLWRVSAEAVATVIQISLSQMPDRQSCLQI